MAVATESNRRAISPWPWLILLLILAFVAVVRIRVADMPLERDEGEYAYAGQLILQGIPPYKLAYNMKLPGTYAAYAGIMAIFGETPRGIRLGFLGVSAASIVLLFFLGRRLLGTKGGLVAAASFGLLSMSPAFLALSAHANHLVVMFALAGLLLLLKAQESGKLNAFFGSGLLLGLSFLMKQQGLFFIFFGGLLILAHAWRNRPLNHKRLAGSLGAFALGSGIPFILTCLVLWIVGVFPKFWFWTFQYAKQYASIVPASDIWVIFSHTFSPILQFTWGFWILAAAGIGAFLSVSTHRAQGWWIITFLLFSALGVSVGFYFRPHYFILVLPALALLVGGFVCLTTEMLPEKPVYGAIPLTIFLGFAIHLIYLHASFFFTLSPVELTTTSYQGNPFHRMPEVAEFIRQNSSPNDRVAVLGSEPELYFLAKRHSATGYIYTYGLMEPQAFALEMQKEMIREIEANAPEFIVMVNIQFSWLRRPDSHRLIFDWLTEYTSAHYRPTGLLDFRSPTEVDEYWNPAGIGTGPHADDFIVVFQRQPSIPKP